jgi:hypothetical protein
LNFVALTLALVVNIRRRSDALLIAVEPVGRLLG